MRKPCTIVVELDPPSRPFYSAGDSVSGIVRLDVASKLKKLSDVQIKLKCEEWSAVALDGKQRQETLTERHKKSIKRAAKRGADAADASAAAYSERRPRARKEHKRHFSLVANLAEGRTETEKFDLDRGVYTYGFNFVLPESISSCPPHCPITTRNDLQVGTRWSLEVVVHRQGIKANVREIIDLPIYPSQVVAGPIDLTYRSELGGMLDMREKASWLDVLKGIQPPIKAQLVARLGYPSKGLPQLKGSPEFTLQVEAPRATIHVTRIKVYLVQKCIANTTKGLSDTYTNMYLLGSANISRIITSPTDLSSLVHHIEIKDVYPAAFTATFIAVTYLLRLEVECKTEGSQKADNLVAEVVVDVLSPTLCWPLENGSAPPARAPTKAVIQSEDDLDEDEIYEEQAPDQLPTYADAVPMTPTSVPQSPLGESFESQTPKSPVAAASK